MKLPLRRSHLLTGVIFALLAAICGAYFFRTTLQTDHATPLPLTADVQATLRALRLPDQNGVEQDFAQWRGKLRVINFWATWCPPCREEMPAFFRLQKKYGTNDVQFVGIALDLATNVRQYAGKSHPPYPLLIGDIAGVNLAMALGNTSQALPYTIVLNRSDQVLLRHLGAINEAELDRLLQKALATPSAG